MSRKALLRRRRLAAPVIAGHLVFVGIAGLLGIAEGLYALEPSKSLTQFTRTVWTQADGLPQDTIRAITQTEDSYLWLGTDEGLARFDGYDFVSLTKDNADLPSNSILALWPAQDGGVWIGTPNGLALYRHGHAKTFTTKDGLPDNLITYLRGDHERSESTRLNSSHIQKSRMPSSA